MKTMPKILLVSYSDAGGGAFIACYRLFCAMQKFGMDVKLGVVEKRTNNDGVFELPRNKNFDRQNARHNKRNLLQTTNSILHSISKLSKIDVDFINKSDFDIVHLHWVAAGTISIEDIAKIKKPIVWTMHDSWVFCGAEHYPNALENDRRFIEGYTKENFPETSSGVDICRLTWERKKKAWKNIKLTFIAPSHFMAESCSQSALFPNVIPNVIPYVIPCFRRLSKFTIRKYYNMPFDKKIIGFGAAYMSSDKRHIKGGYFLMESLKKIKQKENLLVVIFGPANNSFLGNLPIPVFVAGQIQNPYILATIYNSLDVFVCPSIIDNLPNTCIESLFCGIPIAAFDYGGIPDIVEHKVTGYLAKPYNTSDLLRGIEYCIENNKELSKNSIAKAKRDFNEKRIVEKHEEVYKSIFSL
jgi:glycosyltransferase involved in cell wall biosynthesis